MSRSPFLISSFVLAFLAACGGDDDPGIEPSPDATAGSPDAGSPDAGPAAPDGGLGACDPVALLPGNWRPIDKVSAGTVTATVAGDVTTAIIDATAGGFMNAADNPYTYVDLTTGARVDISDVAALTDTRWHVAFKRSNIRVNGGDSGKGGITVAKVEAAALADVTAAPAASEFAPDDWSSDACAFLGSPINEPATRMSEWYAYDERTNRITGPKPEVYVLTVPGGRTFKLRVVGYTDPAMPARTAVYTVEWAAL